MAKKIQKKKKEELDYTDIVTLADKLTKTVSDRVEIDMADDEAIYDGIKSVLYKYLID